MAKKKLTELTEKTTLYKDDLFYIVDSEAATDKGKKVKFSTIRPYKVFSFLANQSGTNALVATILQNELGGIPVWSYEGEGYYKATLANAFKSGKTFCLQERTVFLDGENDVPCYVQCSRGITDDELQLNTFTLETDLAGNGLLTNKYFEVRVYN